jgi:uncharacterized protein (DUF1697 family)
MAIYLSILRGINVSGKNSIKMDALKKMYESLGFTGVITYIQSGNVIFESKSTKGLDKIIEGKIKSEFDYDVLVIVLTYADLKNTIDSNPFVKRTNIESDKLHVTFLTEIPSNEDIKNIASINYTPDEFNIVDKAIYLHCPNGYGNTKLNNTFFEKKLKVKASTRNWKTTNELLKLMS